MNKTVETISTIVIIIIVVIIIILFFFGIYEYLSSQTVIYYVAVPYTNNTSQTLVNLSYTSAVALAKTLKYPLVSKSDISKINIPNTYGLVCYNGGVYNPVNGTTTDISSCSDYSGSIFGFATMNKNQLEIAQNVVPLYSGSNCAGVSQQVGYLALITLPSVLPTASS